MASFEKMAKILMEETTKTAVAVGQLTQDTALLRKVVNNQDLMITQNEKIIDLLAQLRGALGDKGQETL
jgi:hypothetical protein